VAFRYSENIANDNLKGGIIMIEVGKQAPDFELASHLGGTKFTLGQFKGQKNVMLVFYPLDWTPT
jgi:peroxiredoxin